MISLGERERRWKLFSPLRRLSRPFVTSRGGEREETKNPLVGLAKIKNSTRCAVGPQMTVGQKVLEQPDV